MLYRIGTIAESSILASIAPKDVCSDIMRNLTVLDVEYGKTRNYMLDGGYIIIATTTEDVEVALNTVGKSQLCECVIKLGNSGWVSILYLLNDDFAVVLYTLQSVLPTMLLQEMEENKP